MGGRFTVTATVAVPEQPLLVPVTVYEVPVVGLTLIAAVLAPVFQE